MSKSDPLRVADYLAHIVEAIDRIHRYVEDMAELAFLEDEKTQDAVVRNFEILGTSKWTMNWCGRRFMRICRS